MGLAGSKKTAAAAAGKPTVSAKRKGHELGPVDEDSDSDSDLFSNKVVLIVLLILIRVYTASTTRKTIDTRWTKCHALSSFSCCNPPRMLCFQKQAQKPKPARSGMAKVPITHLEAILHFVPRPAVIGQSPVFDAGAGQMCIKLYPDWPLRDASISRPQNLPEQGRLGRSFQRKHHHLADGLAQRVGPQEKWTNWAPDARRRHPAPTPRWRDGASDSADDAHGAAAGADGDDAAANAAASAAGAPAAADGDPTAAAADDLTSKADPLGEARELAAAHSANLLNAEEFASAKADVMKAFSSGGGAS
jgi:hypothetical protein